MNKLIEGPVYGTVEWQDFRRGLVTASRFGDIMADTALPENVVEEFAHLVTTPRYVTLKSGGEGKKQVPGFSGLVATAMESAGHFYFGKGAQTYMRELVAAAITGIDKVGGRSAAMERGVDMEADALEYYAQRRFVEVKEGRILRWEGTIIAATPDLFVEDDPDGPGQVQAKCPNSDTHLQTYWDQLVPEDYHWQIQGELMVTGRLWCDFLSFDDRFPEPLKAVTIRVKRNEEAIARMELRIRAFADRVVARIADLRRIIEAANPAERATIMEALNADANAEV